MLKKIGLLTVVPFLFSEVSADECRLQGLWKSDNARTLAGVAPSDALEAQSLNGLSNGLFGHMYHEWRCASFRAWFDDADIEENESTWVPYKIVNSSNGIDTVLIDNDSQIKLQLEWEGDCYKVPVAGHEFSEYFCPDDGGN